MSEIRVPTQSEVEAKYLDEEDGPLPSSAFWRRSGPP